MDHFGSGNEACACGTRSTMNEIYETEPGLRVTLEI